MSYEQILTEKKDDALVITLNRPDKLNAWTYKMKAELAAAIERANGDGDIGAIVVTGAGRGFCAGADIEDSFQARLDKGSDTSSGQGDATAADWVELVRRSKPLVAALNGVAVGVGITMVLPFDVIVASERAKIGMFFVRMGLVPELASSHFLVQRVGFALASEMCLSGKLYEASEIAGTGLVNQVVAHEELLVTALGHASRMAANPAPSLRLIKSLLTRNGSCADLARVQARETEALAEAYATAEHREAVAAFMEKREPDFKRAAGK